jgi:hypothetical protein
MSLPTRLVLMPFLQRWDGDRLFVRVIVAPQTDPLSPPAPGLTPYASTDFQFETRLVADASVLPDYSSAATVDTWLSPAPAQAADLCTALDAVLAIDKTVGPADGRIGAPTIVKHAPSAYCDASGYRNGDNRYLFADDTYRCAIKAPIPSGTSIKATPPVMSWGKVLAQVLRQPLMCEAVGVVRAVDLEVPASIVADGGWFYVTLKTGSPWAALLTAPGAIKLYAARISPLPQPCALFTPVLFPIPLTGTAAAPFDDLFRESIDYDDGFAKTVYGRQPNQADPTTEEEGERPHEDYGLQLGWDDEQLVTWFNRQLDTTPTAPDAPMGVMGYRVDVRATAADPWESLALAHTEIAVGPVDLGEATTDFRLEVAPNRLLGDASGRSWLPAFYAHWKGRSLVGFDTLEGRLKGIAPAPQLVEGVLPTTVLRYGRAYQFRVRFCDLTGGGPELGDAPRNGGPQPVLDFQFRRYVRPTAARLVTNLPLDPDPSAPPNAIEVTRPLLGFPSCLMVGGTEADLVADIAPAMVAKRAPGLPDTDVDSLEIVVQLSTPEPGAGDVFETLYTTTRPYPAAGNLTISLDWRDIADVATLVPPAAGGIVVPTSRTVRLMLTPLAAAKPNYYGGEDVRRGETISAMMRRPAADERQLLRQGGSSLIEGIFLQPVEPASPAFALAQVAAGRGGEAAGDPLGSLAAALNLDRAGTALRARHGQRLMIGASSHLRHVIGPDGASLTFATATEMVQLWLVAVVLDLKRDWSWDGLDRVEIWRDGSLAGGIAGTVMAGHEATDAPARDRSRLIFIDAIDPKPAPGANPRPLTLDYEVRPIFRIAPTQSDPALAVNITLPVTTRPSQVPKIVAAGLALSPYARDADYASTEDRMKAVWLEFDRVPDDPEDQYFARLLAMAPDPVLTETVSDVPDIDEPPLPIDPEPMRRITPGQGDDHAGAAAMQPLLPTSSPVHFLLPLPPGLTSDSPELFGFFTYDFRVGHVGPWSTAQGRFGRSLRVAGIQHAPPPLTCAVTRTKARLTVSASFADPVIAGRSIQPNPPVTELWALLYARVVQADGADRRNILIGTRKLARGRDATRPQWGKPNFSTGRQKSIAGAATWSATEIVAGLHELTLGPDAPLSCLVVETLPGEQPYLDPLGAQLGYERFLRTSPLASVPTVC